MGEFKRGTDPRDADSDDDGIDDGAECAGARSTGVDSDDDGVNDDAEVECEDHHGRGDEDDGHADDHGNHGPGGSGHHGSSSDD